jgi:hypothetical protein
MARACYRRLVAARAVALDQKLSRLQALFAELEERSLVVSPNPKPLTAEDAEHAEKS